MTDRTKSWAEMAADCATDAANATDHDDAMEWIVLSVANALLAIHDTLTALKPEPATVTHPWSNPLTVTHPWPPWPSTLPGVTAADRYAANEAKQREAGDADGAPSVTAPVADDPVDDAVDEEECERRYLNAQTGLDATDPDLFHLTILRDTVSDWRDMSTPSVSTRGWQRGWRAGVDLCTAILAEIADEYEREMRGGRRG